MVYEVPASRASLKQNRFEFRAPGSKTIYSIPKVQFIRPSVLRELQVIADGVSDGGKPTPEQAQAMYRLQLDLFEYYIPGFADLFDDSEQIGALMVAWQADSEITLGEASAS